MLPKIALIICFSFLSGCSIFTPSFKETWELPPKPKTQKLNIEKVKPDFIYLDGFYMSQQEAKKLADNVDELKAYIEKMEILVREMSKYYNAKVEEK